MYNCNKQFVAECLISSVVLLPISLYFPIFVLPYFDEQFLDDSFGNSDHNSVRPEKQPDRNAAESQSVKPNMTQHESQMTQQPFGLRSLTLPKFLGICATISGHDPFVSSINKNLGCP
jgi:hypothetical protein